MISAQRFSFLRKLAQKDRRKSKLGLLRLAWLPGMWLLALLWLLRTTLLGNLDYQARQLMGADLTLYADSSFAQVDTTFFHLFPFPQADELRLTSMVQLGANGPWQLVQLIGIKGPFPFYGRLQTLPHTAYRAFRLGKTALPAEALVRKYPQLMYDSLRIGEQTIAVAGSMASAPGQTQLSSGFLPNIYVPYALLQKSGLVAENSRVSYRKYFKSEPGVSPNRLLRLLKKTIDEHGYRYETVGFRKDSLSGVLQNLFVYLDLLGTLLIVFTVLGIYATTRSHSYLKQPMAAQLMALGLSRKQVRFVWQWQLGWLSFWVVLIAVALAAFLFPLLLRLLSNWLGYPAPEIQVNYSYWLLPLWAAGLLLCLLIDFPFHQKNQSLFRSIRRKPRTNIGSSAKSVAAAALWVLALEWLFVNELQQALLYLGVTAAVLLALAAVGKLLQLLAQWLVQNGSSFVARQALRNLQRKGNFLQILFMVMGGSAYLLVVLLSLQSSLLAQLNALEDENQLNLLLLDIAPKQHPQLLKLLEKASAARSAKQHRNLSGGAVALAASERHVARQLPEIRQQTSARLGFIPRPPGGLAQRAFSVRSGYQRQR